MEISDSDRELIAVMRQYFAGKAELESLKEQLEAERQAAGEAIGVFYEPPEPRARRRPAALASLEGRNGVADTAC
ncbi:MULTISPECIES: hypothetical protein [Sinorhizobium]|uniref:hypothetical protein n=1 Tax=Sinorhizobium TaxID=28105 RepID=UPI001F259B29|nr:MULTISPECIES: hypothetical protein [Sinorhizobium]